MRLEQTNYTMPKTLFLFLALAFLASCSKFTRAMKHPDWKVRYAAANAYYEKGDFYRASMLLEELVTIIKNDKAAEDIHYKFANSCAEEKRLVDAEYYFRTFYATYRQSPKAEEALYLASLTLSKMSPQWYLDQENTRLAIESLQDFINRYPKSPRAADASQIIINLREKQEIKAYNNAKLFYKLDRHKSAVIVLDNFQKDFPDSKYKEEAAFLALEALFAFADASFAEKQDERYREVIARYETFLDKFPKSEYLRQAQNIFSAARRGLQTLANKAADPTLEKTEKTSDYDQ